MAPSDDYFIRDAPGPRPQGGNSSGGEAGQGGERAGGAGAGGAAENGGESGASGGSEGGAAGIAGAGGSGGCGADSREEEGACVSISGCSDGSREAFLTPSDWPNLAGCTAQWPRASLRDAKTGVACGFELGVCAVPADACGEGWHVCASPPYAPTEISDQTTAEECASQPGAYVAAVGDQFCEPCSEIGDGAACCGDRCVQQNGNCIFPGQTAWFGVYNGHKNVCGAIESDLLQRGVLCCRD
ncbi:MAG: hypothetical protein K0R38_6857 [Polyangiaceae bacterium]|jgi:hypothetical protein|nr:hypothetical protein [Polyangiaceae bacterium]